MILFFTGKITAEYQRRLYLMNHFIKICVENLHQRNGHNLGISWSIVHENPFIIKTLTSVNKFMNIAIIIHFVAFCKLTLEMNDALNKIGDS